MLLSTVLIAVITAALFLAAAWKAQGLPTQAL
ncbi:MAG: hypothetical protein BDTLLHRC_001579, partial [Candidatus Fervidibacter sp.]